MAAIRRGKKADFLRKKSRRQKGPRKNVTKQRKLPSNQKKKNNMCAIRFPKSSYLRACPLVAWYFDRRMHNDVLSFRRRKNFGQFYHSCKMPLPAGRQKKHPWAGRACPDFLEAALKEVASKKRAKWVVPPTKRRQHYSDEEIFYRLANASEEEGGSSSDPGTSDMATHPPTLSQPLANEPQPVSI